MRMVLATSMPAFLEASNKMPIMKKACPTPTCMMVARSSMLHLSWYDSAKAISAMEEAPNMARQPMRVWYTPRMVRVVEVFIKKNVRFGARYVANPLRAT